MRKPVIYTVGHSSHSIDFFLDLLQSFAISCVVDVRSVPASSYNPQFNREPLSAFLRAHDIGYIHFGREFGARPKEPELLDSEGRVDFEKVQGTAAFRSGVEKLRQGVEEGYRLALMCSEAEPFDCHRFAMVSAVLVREGFEVLHILRDKTVKANSELEEQLLKKYARSIPQIHPRPSLFAPDITREEQVAMGYRLRNRDIGFSPYKKEEERL